MPALFKSAVMFWNNFFLFMLCTLISLLSLAIHDHPWMSQYVSVLTTCTFSFDKFAPLNPHSLKRRDVGDASSSFEGLHVVINLLESFFSPYRRFLMISRKRLHFSFNFIAFLAVTIALFTQNSTCAHARLFHYIFTNESERSGS